MNRRAMSFPKHALIAGLVLMSPCWGAASDTPYQGFQSSRVACPGESRGFVIVFPKEAAPGKPWKENAKIVKERYEAMGGPIELIQKPGIGHHPHGLEDPSPILDLIRKHTKQ